MSRSNTGLTWRVFSSATDLVHAFPDTSRIFIDVPIGLPWADVPIRPCDRLARKHLGTPRKSSVFPVPCREALSAEKIEEARRINKACIGRSIGTQTWGICPKIKEVDELLLSLLDKPHNIREIHPEVCFWALAGGRPMQYSKAKVQGRHERLQVLQKYEPGIQALLDDALARTLRKDVQPDDILDAAVAFITAEARHGELVSLAAEPVRDLNGLPIEMLYIRT